MNNQNSEKYIFIKREELGKCPKCNKEVFSDNLYVEKEKEVFHLSCHNNNDKK